MALSLFARCASLSVVVLSLAGCSGGLVPTAAVSSVSVTGNWQVSSSATAAAKLPMISGELTGSGSNITGIFHAAAGSSCLAANAPFELVGSADSKNVMTLKAANVAGGTLTLTGTLAADGKSVTGASYNVTGGSCAFAQAATAQAQAFTPIAGTFNGSFSDPDGRVLDVSAQLTQTPQSDTSGNFQLSGTGTFPKNPCFHSPVTVTNTQVTGGSFMLTYNDDTTMNSVTANGTFSEDGSTLTVTSWVLNGTCGVDMGTGLLTKQ